ncbi:SpoIVB peptidase [Peptococcaceae bacterium 1198_IL3148]
MNRDKIKFTAFITIILLTMVCFNTQVMHLGTLPLTQKITVGESLDLGFKATGRFLNALQVDINDSSTFTFTLTSTAPIVTTPGELNMTVKLFGIIPLRQVTIDVVPQTKVVPGGHSVGVMVHSRGVMVVGMSTVENAEGKQFNPAQNAGIKVGDVLLKINGNAVKTESQVRSIINQASKSKKVLIFELERHGRTYTTEVNPVYNHNTKQYMVGLFIRDSAAGVGTLTFYDPKTKSYGALGHIITDIDTGKKVDMSNGRIIGAYIQGIHPGQKGQPGEKVGIIETNNSMSGTINSNTPYGIFGQLSQPIKNPFFNDPIAIALTNQIEEGPAEIFTVLEGNKIERFKIEIEKVARQSHPEGKGMIIKITDPKLLKTTGGIIQGMSGSPIIQYKNDQPLLVGAVTHVFINDPTRGYGVLAEWMLQQTKTMSKINKNNMTNDDVISRQTTNNAA